MKFQGKLIKDGRWWVVDIDILKIGTQGRTKKEAYEMAKDALEMCIEQPGFVVDIQPGRDNTFTISSNDDRLLAAFALKQHRHFNGLSIREVAKRIGSKSPTAYSRYEQAKTRLSLDKFSQLMSAIDPALEPVITL